MEKWLDRREGEEGEGEDGPGLIRRRLEGIWGVVDRLSDLVISA